LEAIEVPNQAELAQALIEAGAALDEPLMAAASVNNVVAVSALLNAGAAVDGRGSWTPLEEALYWCSHGVIELLLARGAAVRNLRSAAGLGRTELIEGFFDAAGALTPDAGGIDWPFGDPTASNHPASVKAQLVARFNGWDRTPRGVINNAFVFACMHNQLEAARLLLGRDAEINTIPPGFDFAGTGLHYAALYGHVEMVDFLLACGADASIRDPKVNNTPAGWAEYGGHQALAAHLQDVGRTPA